MCALLNKAFLGVLALLLALLAPRADAQFWTNAAGGNWDNNFNWAPGPWPTAPPAFYPDAVGALADFQYIPGMVGPINITSGFTPFFTVGALRLEGDGTLAANGYHLTNTFGLVMDNGGGVATIDINPAGFIGNHVIDSNVWMNDQLLFRFYTGHTLTVNGTIADWPGPVPPPNGIPKNITILSVPGSTLLWTGANTFTGLWRIAGGGTLELRDPLASGTTTGAVAMGNSIGASSTLFLNGMWGDVNITEIDLSMFGAMGSNATINSANGNNSINLMATLFANTDSVISTQGFGSLTINATNLDMVSGGSGMNFDTAFGTDLFINAQLTGNAFLNKTGMGRAVLSQPGSWTGDLMISAGVVEILNATALGGMSNNSIINGGSLHINNTTGTGWTVAENSIKMFGTGSAGEGAIYNQAGTNRLVAPGGIFTTDLTTITAEDTTRLAIFAKIDLAGLSTATNQLTLNTNGPSPTSSYIVINGPISNSVSPGELIKTGNGTAILNQQNFYDGITYVQQGVLQIRHNDALGNPTGLTQVFSGATLALDNNIKVPEQFLEISGLGVPGGRGAIDNYGGSNVISGVSIILLTSTTIGATAGDLRIHSTVDMSGGNLTIDTAGGTQVDFANSVFDSGSLFSVIKNGPGDARFSGVVPNDYAGNTIINDGTLVLDKSPGTDAIGNSGAATNNVIVNTGGTLLLAQADQMNDSTVNMQLNGGTFNTGGHSETLGTLTLTSNSILDLASLSSVVKFDDSSALTWTGILEIWNWSGTLAGGGIDQVWFGGSSLTGLTASQLSQIVFYSDSGMTSLGTAQWASTGTGEITPVPEPSTVLVGMLLAGMIFWRERGWILRHRRREPVGC